MVEALRRFGWELTAAWIALVAATCLSWYLGDGHGAATVGSIGVLVVAFMKVHVVGQHFMELRGAPPMLRRLFRAWCVVAGSLLIVMYAAG
jgi:hypothetical protein